MAAGVNSAQVSWRLHRGIRIDRLSPGLAAYSQGDEYRIAPDEGERDGWPKTIAITRGQAARLLVETAEKWGEPVPEGVRAMAKARTNAAAAQKRS